MKKIAVVMPKFAPGGAEKSLLMFLHLFSERPDVQIDLILFKKEGIFLGQLPNKVNVVEAEQSLKVAFSKFDIKNCVDLKNILISVLRPISTAIAHIFSRTPNHKSQLRWRYCYKYLIKRLDAKYDIACGYLDGESIYYVVDKINAKVKYGWNQNDYVGLGFNAKIDQYYYYNLDRIITLTDECERILVEIFPEFKNKINQIPPIVTQGYIRTCAKEFYPKEYEGKDGIKLISVGRLVEQKGFDLAIKAASIINKKGISFSWYIIGNGALRESLGKLIVDEGVTENVYLIGERGNPYPYVKEADIFIQPSRFEGKSVILNEAKMLCKPIIVTAYPTVFDQILNGFDGVIVEMNEKALAEGILSLINNRTFQQTFEKNLMNTNFENSKVTRAYERLFELEKENEQTC